MQIFLSCKCILRAAYRMLNKDYYSWNLQDAWQQKRTKRLRAVKRAAAA